MKPFYLSRKFLTAALDVGVSLALYFIGKYAAPSLAEDMITVIVAIQPVFVMVIAGIAWEDAAALKAGSHPSQGQG